jgi:hypothetical protein
VEDPADTSTYGKGSNEGNTEIHCRNCNNNCNDKRYENLHDSRHVLTNPRRFSWGDEPATEVGCNKNTMKKA